MVASVFELFKIGVGPSSSHTMGPMTAAADFAASLSGLPVARIAVALYGSLALTGRGHATDRALLLGLGGHRPDTVDPDAIEGIVAGIGETRRLDLPDGRVIAFDPAADIAWKYGAASAGFPLQRHALRRRGRLWPRARGKDGLFRGRRRGAGCGERCAAMRGRRCWPIRPIAIARARTCWRSPRARD